MLQVREKSLSGDDILPDVDFCLILSSKQKTMNGKNIWFMAPVVLCLMLLAGGCEKEDGYQKEIADIDGNKYKTVRLGEQVWMAENLRTKNYADGTEIPGVRVYADDEGNAGVYGRLYTWDAALRGGADKKGNIQGPCPKGWRMPTDGDWKQLEEYIGLPADQLNNIAWRGTTEGGMLKEAGTDYWQTPNSEASNTTLFSARGGGHYNVGLGYSAVKVQAFFWTATESEATNAWNRVLQYASGEIGRYEASKGHSLCIRCIKN